jgi:hypothetical protein
MYINIEELKGKKTLLESDIKKLQDAIEYKLTKGEYDVDNMCGRVNQWERMLAVIINQLRAYDPCDPQSQTEQDRKAIAILGGGKGVEIRPKNDDPAKYTVRKRLTYGEIIQKKLVPKPNGKPKPQQQSQQQTASV